MDKKCENIGATFIVLRVPRLDLLLSYVALGAHVWLGDFSVHESISSSTMDFYVGNGLGG